MIYEFFSYLKGLDHLLFSIINSVAGQKPTVDFIANRLNTDGLKGLAFMGSFGVFWFQRAQAQGRRRETLVLILFALVLSMVAARTLADLLPYRIRPMFISGIGYRAPLFPTGTGLERWSSFPSDNAAFLFVLTTGFWLLSRWWGILWACFSLISLLARIYVGVHYPADVLAGALIGIGVTIAINNDFMHARIASPIVAVEQRAPAIFYALLFPIVFEAGRLFGFARSTGNTIFHLLGLLGYVS